MLFEPKPVLKGTQIYLKKPKPTFEMADMLFHLIEQNRDYLLPWVEMADLDITGSLEDTFLHLVNMTSKWFRQYAFEYLIFDNKTNQLIGLIGAYQPFPEHKSIEVGFWMSKNFTRQGKVCEALHLIETEFFFLEFERIVIRIDSNNHRARHFTIKCGYQFEGTLRHAYWSNQLRAYRDLDIFAKLKNECKSM